MINDGKRFVTDNGFHIPEHMLASIQAYIHQHRPVGDFLQAVIANDLKEAVMHADDTNIRNLPAYAYYFYQYAPYACWGSRKAYMDWIEIRYEKQEKQPG